MAFSEEVCLICGAADLNGESKLSFGSKKQSFRQKKIMNLWHAKCTKVICEILFGIDAQIFLKCFQNNRYCSNCDQILRDVNFYWTQIKVFESKISSLAEITRNLISRNFKANSSYSKIENLDCFKSSISNKGADGLQQFSRSEIVEIMYRLSEKQQNLSAVITSEGVKIKSEKISFGADNVNLKEEQFEHEYNESALDSMDDFDFDLPNMDNEDFGEVNNKNRNVPKGRKPPMVRIFQETKKRKVEKEENTWIRSPRKPKQKSNKKTKSTVPPEEYLTNLSQKLHVKKCNLSKEQILELRKKRRLLIDAAYRKRKFGVLCPEEGCNEYLRFESMIDDHIRDVHKGEMDPYHCQQCSEKFQTYELMSAHIVSYHNRKHVKPHSCKICGQGYFKEKDLNDHLSVSHQGPNPFKCGFCDEEYTYSTALRLHVKDVHFDIKEKSPCEICGKYYYNRQMKQHLKVHQAKYNCNLCDKTFISRSQFECHMDSVHQQRSNPVICEVCGGSYGNEYKLKAHIRKAHSDPQRFKCKICDKGFKFFTNCASHEITHTGIRNFVCKVCGKAFFTKQVLAGHELTHQEGYVPRKFHRRKKPENSEQTNPIDVTAMSSGIFFNASF